MIRSFVEDLENKKWQGVSINVSGAIKYQQRLLDIAYLKAAYLAAFAKFGYSYIKHDVLSLVRSQIKSPECKIIPKYRFFMSDESESRLGVCYR